MSDQFSSPELVLSVTITIISIIPATECCFCYQYYYYCGRGCALFH